MASLSYEIATELYVIKEVFQENDDFMNANAIDTAIDLTDAVSKRHLPVEEYLDLLIEMFEHNMGYDVESADGYREALDIVRERKEKELKLIQDRKTVHALLGF